MKQFEIESINHAASGGHFDGESVATAHHSAGFSVIALGGIKLVDQIFATTEDADAYVQTCIVAVHGQQILRETLEDKRIHVRATMPLFPEGGDRSKIPIGKNWDKLPFEPAWWHDGELVPLPAGWENWGTRKGGEPIKEHRGNRCYNVGLRTGSAAGLVIIDIDQHHGIDGLAALKEKFGDRFDTLFPSTYTVRSPTGGLHYYYATTAPISNSAGLLVRGVDVRGEGGQVVAAGSVRMNGHRYTIINPVDLVPMPTEMEELLLSLRPVSMGRKREASRQLVQARAVPRERVLQNCLAKHPKVEPGQRHDTLMSVAGFARNLIESDDDLEWVIRQFAEEQGVASRDTADLEHIVADAKALSRTPQGSARVQILVDTEQGRVVQELERAMSDAPGLFCRGGALVRVLPPFGRVLLPPLVQAVPRDVLGPWTTAHIEWAKEKREDGVTIEVPCHPPAWAINAFLAAGNWPNVPDLVGVFEHPVFLADGRVLAASGYDRESGILLLPRVAADPIPEHPTQDEARQALCWLDEIICDFPFADDVAHSAALAAMLTPAARQAIAGCVPLMVIDKSTRGVGGSLFTDVISTLYMGRPMARVTQAGSEEEQRKVITSLLLDASPLVLFDNIGAPLGGAALDALLTGESWKDRLLGTNITVTLPVGAIFYATGNNITFKGDTSRRALKIRMVSNLENPEERQGFRHANLRAWVAAERARLLTAALTVLRAFHVAGRPLPNPGFAPWGSFDGWSDLIRGVLVWLGQPDPGLARGALDDAVDADKTALAELVHGWAEVAIEPKPALTVRDVLDLLALDGTGKRHRLLRGLFTLPNGNLMPSKDVVAKFLRKYKDRTIDGMCITDAGMSRTKTTLWVVRVVDADVVKAIQAAEQSEAPQPEPLTPVTTDNGSFVNYL
jgi:hypothetical protein